jgi:hypothetical protein
MAACGFGEKEPQINADERRSSPVTGFLDNPSYASHPATDFGVAHRKVRKERKAQSQCGTRMTRIGRIFTDPCASASSVQSVFHHVCFSLKNTASGASVSAFIRVHPRFLKNVIFRTVFTGCGFNPVHPVILSNSKFQGGRVEI